LSVKMPENCLGDEYMCVDMYVCCRKEKVCVVSVKFIFELRLAQLLRVSATIG